MDDWQRLEQVIKWTGHSVNAFALGIGLKRSENLYQIKKGNHGVSKELAELITTKYTNISKGWLLAGDGEMLVDHAATLCSKETCSILLSSVNFYNIDAAMLRKSDDLSSLQPLYSLNIPSFGPCDFALKNMGNSMAPEIPNGAVVALKSVDLELFMPGEAYLVVTDDFSVIRYVRRVMNDDSRLLLVPLNINDFDAVEIDRAKISKLFIVAGVVITRIL